MKRQLSTMALTISLLGGMNHLAYSTSAPLDITQLTDPEDYYTVTQSRWFNRAHQVGAGVKARTLEEFKTEISLVRYVDKKGDKDFEATALKIPGYLVFLPSGGQTGLDFEGNNWVFKEDSFQDRTLNLLKVLSGYSAIRQNILAGGNLSSHEKLIPVFVRMNTVGSNGKSFFNSDMPEWVTGPAIVFDNGIETASNLFGGIPSSTTPSQISIFGIEISKLPTLTIPGISSVPNGEVPALNLFGASTGQDDTLDFDIIVSLAAKKDAFLENPTAYNKGSPVSLGYVEGISRMSAFYYSLLSNPALPQLRMDFSKGSLDLGSFDNILQDNTKALGISGIQDASFSISSKVALDKSSGTLPNGYIGSGTDVSKIASALTGIAFDTIKLIFNEISQGGRVIDYPNLFKTSVFAFARADLNARLEANGTLSDFFTKLYANLGDSLDGFGQSKITKILSSFEIRAKASGIRVLPLGAGVTPGVDDVMSDLVKSGPLDTKATFRVSNATGEERTAYTKGVSNDLPVLSRTGTGIAKLTTIDWPDLRGRETYNLNNE